MTSEWIWPVTIITAQWIAVLLIWFVARPSPNRVRVYAEGGKARPRHLGDEIPALLSEGGTVECRYGIPGCPCTWARP